MMEKDNFYERLNYFKIDEEIVETEMGNYSTIVRGGNPEYCLAQALEYIEQLEIQLGILLVDRRTGRHLEKEFEALKELR